MARCLLLLPLLLLLLGLANAHHLQLKNIIASNISGYLVSKNGRFFVQPAIDSRRPDEQQIESLANEEESWSDSDEEEEEKEESGVQSVEPSDVAKEDEADDENEVYWVPRPKPWWHSWTTPGIRSRGFSFFGVFESAIGTISKLIGNFIGDDDDYDDVDTGNAVNYKDHQLLRITPKSHKQVRHLEQLKDSEPDDVKFWTLPAKDKTTDLLVSPSILNDVKQFLRNKKIAYQILISDLQSIITKQNPRAPKERRQDLYSSQGHSMDWKRYHRYKDIMGYLDYLALKYPHLVEVTSIGDSFEGRPLKIIKVSTGAKKNGDAKPVIWIDAGMHAREWISTSVAAYILNQLVEKSSNYTRLLDVTDWVVMPLANPDGYEFTHTGDRLWRKTRSTHSADSDDDDSDDEARQSPGFLHMLTHYTKWLFGTCEGVDPNRNFAVHWGEDKVKGASTDPCHDTYAGPRPFSEPETRAISDYIMSNKDTIRTYLTLHSYSQMLLVPWGFTRERPDDFDALMNIANKAKKAIAKVHGTEYKVGPAAELLYPTTGSSDDWAKKIAGVKYAYTMELRDRGAYGFLLPASLIMPTARETWAGVRVIARMAALSSP